MYTHLHLSVHRPHVSVHITTLRSVTPSCHSPVNSAQHPTDQHYSYESLRLATQLGHDLLLSSDFLVVLPPSAQSLQPGLEGWGLPYLAG